MNLLWLNEVTNYNDNWSKTYIYNAWVAAKENSDLRRMLEPLVNVKFTDLNVHFSGCQDSLLKSDFLRKMKGAWFSKLNRNAKGTTLALNCIIEKRAKMLLKKMAKEKKCSVASMINEMILMKAKKAKGIKPEELTKEYYEKV